MALKTGPLEVLGFAALVELVEVVELLVFWAVAVTANTANRQTDVKTSFFIIGPSFVKTRESGRRFVGW